MQKCSAQFKAKDADLLLQVIDKVTAEAYAPGEIILAQGKEDDRLVVLLEGQAIRKKHGIEVA